MTKPVLSAIAVVLITCVPVLTKAQSAPAPTARRGVPERIPDPQPTPDPRDPEVFRHALLGVAVTIEQAWGIEPRVSQRIATAPVDDLRQWVNQFPDPARFIDAAGRIVHRRASARIAPTINASTPFPPDYPPNSGAYKDTILDPISFTGIPVSNTDRCGTETWADFFEVWYLADYTVRQLQALCVVGSCDPTGVACLATCTPVELAQIAANLAYVPIQLCDVHEGSVNSAEIEAGYENSVRILGDLAAHDANITARLTALDARLAVHDAEVQARLARIEAKLDQLALRRIDLQVVEIKNRESYLVRATEGGRGVSVTFDAIEVFDDGAGAFTPIGGATAGQIEPGSYLVHMNPSSQHPDKIFRFRVHHDEVGGDVVFHRLSGQTLGVGQ